MSKIKHYKFTMDMYPSEIHILVGKWHANRARKMLKLKRGGRLMPPARYARACCWDMGPRQAIWLPGRPDTTKADADLVHEITHAAIGAGEALGFDDVSAASEFYCYFTGWLYSAVKNRLK